MQQRSDFPPPSEAQRGGWIEASVQRASRRVGSLPTRGRHAGRDPTRPSLRSGHPPHCAASPLEGGRSGAPPNNPQADCSHFVLDKIPIAHHHPPVSFARGALMRRLWAERGCGACGRGRRIPQHSGGRGSPSDPNTGVCRYCAAGRGAGEGRETWRMNPLRGIAQYPEERSFGQKERRGGAP